MAAIIEFPHENDPLFRPKATDSEKIEKKRSASATALDLFAQKVRAAKKRLDKMPLMNDGTPVEEEKYNVQKSQLEKHREAYERELYKRRKFLAQVEPKIAPLQNGDIPQIQPPRMLEPSSALRKWRSKDGKKADRMVNELFIAAQREAEGKGLTPEGVREYAVNEVISRMNQSFVHITEENPCIWYVTTTVDRITNITTTKTMTMALQNEKGLLGLVGRVRTLTKYAKSDMSTSEVESFLHKSWFSIWIDSLDRHQYPCLTFTPPTGVYVGEDGFIHHETPDTTDMFNLYTGVAIAPEETGPANKDWASHPIVKDFLNAYHDAYSPTSPEVREWYLNYIAHNVQKPGVLPKCGAHVEGDQGTMKGFMVDIPSSILGANYKHHARNLESLTGRFANTYGKLIVFADEIAFSGDYKTQDVLKKMITESAITVEQKYMNPFLCENMAHFYSASNNKNALDIEASNRRFVLLSTRYNHGRKMDLKRFYTPEARLALAGYFYRRDISDYEPSDLPEGGTIEAGAKVRSLRGFQRWITDYLQGPTAPFGTYVPKQTIYEAYKSATPRANITSVFWKDMHQLFGDKLLERRAGSGGSEGKYVRLPSLKEARNCVCEMLHIHPSNLVEAADKHKPVASLLDLREEEEHYAAQAAQQEEEEHYAAQAAQQQEEEHCAAQAAQQQEEEHCAAQAAQQEDKDAEVALAESQLTDILANMNAAKSAHDNDMYDSDNENDPDIDPTLIDCMNDAFAHIVTK